MKKLIALAVSSLLASSAFAITQTGTIHLNGYIYPSTCTIDINGNGPSDATVDMGRYPTSAFSQVGTEVGGTDGKGKIDIQLLDCPDDGQLEVKFNGKSVNDSNTLELDNINSAATAQGVGIILYTQDGNAVPIDGSIAIQKKVDHSKSYEYSLNAKYIRYATKDDEVKPGIANSTLGFTISYR